MTSAVDDDGSHRLPGIRAVTHAASTDNARRIAGRYLRVFIIGIPLTYVVLIALSWNHVGSRDLDQFVVFHELQYWNQSLFGFAKQWSPLLCSGLSIAGEPQVPVLSLSMMLAYLIGPFRGIEVAVLMYLVIGWIGAYLYAGLCTKIRVQRLLAASLFIGNGFFVCRIAHGHIDAVPFLILPSVLWLLHRVCSLAKEPDIRRSSIIALSILSLAAAISVAIDGSPVAILHLLFWIGIYAFALSAVERSVLPVFVVAAAAAIAVVLDAGYLWPMVASQTEFPRRTMDTFTNPLALLWFMLLPVRGKLILPATGNGHELSVFIGPVIAIALWRYRHELTQGSPASVRYPLIAVGVFSIWLGMGSLNAIHIPAWLSLFDWLRPLPGFRSIWVTGRYWGFLALPLSLFGGIALHRFASALPSVRSLHAWMAFAVLLQFGFQIQTLVSNALPGRSHIPVEPQSWFSDEAEGVRYVYCGAQFQGAFITPRQGVIDCYDNDDFVRADMHAGSQLVQQAHVQSTGAAEQVTARFVTWNLIRLAFVAPPEQRGGEAPVEIVLNQAHHRFWRSEDCDVGADGRGNMIATCDRGALSRGPLDLKFHDSLSALGARVSLTAWSVWLLAMLAVFVLRRASR